MSSVRIWLPRYKKRPLVGLFLYLRARSNCEVCSAKTPMSEVKAKAFLSLCASISPKGEMERSVISQSGYPDTQKDPLWGSFVYYGARSNCEVCSAKTPLNEVKVKAFLSLCASISPKGEMERSVISQSGYPDTQKDPLWGSFVYYGARSNCEVCSAKTPMSEAKAKDTRRKRRVPFGIESCTPIKSYPAVRSGIPSPEPGLSGSTPIIYTR